MLDFNPGQTLLILTGMFLIIYGRRLRRWMLQFNTDWKAFSEWKNTHQQQGSGVENVLQPVLKQDQAASLPSLLSYDLATIDRSCVPGAGGAMLNTPQNLAAALTYLNQYVARGRMSFPIGWWSDGTSIHLAVGHFVDDIYNILVTAMPGSGKDNLILNMAYSLMLQYTPEEIQFFVMDGKGGADYIDWIEKAHVFHIAEEGYELAEAMTLLSAIKLERKRWLKQARVSSWDNYRGADRPPLMIVVISELTQLLEVMTRNEVESWLMREVNVWRGLGLRLVVGTQNTSGWSKEWRAAMECFFAGLQPSSDEVRPNTGKSIKELEALGVIPPHRLPNVRGVFTAVHRSTAVNIRTSYLSDGHREQLTALLPDLGGTAKQSRNEYKQVLIREWHAFNAMIAEGESKPLIESGAPSLAEGEPKVEPKQESPTLQTGYDRSSLLSLFTDIQSNRSRRLDELLNSPLFIHACAVEYAHHQTISGVVRALWGEYSGTKDRLVKAALEQHQNSETLLQGLLAA